MSVAWPKLTAVYCGGQPSNNPVKSSTRQKRSDRRLEINGARRVDESEVSVRPAVKFSVLASVRSKAPVPVERMPSEVRGRCVPPAMVGEVPKTRAPGDRLVRNGSQIGGGRGGQELQRPCLKPLSAGRDGESGAIGERSRGWRAAAASRASERWQRPMRPNPSHPSSTQPNWRSMMWLGTSA